jgi:hypothetical protein
MLKFRVTRITLSIEDNMKTFKQYVANEYKPLNEGSLESLGNFLEPLEKNILDPIGKFALKGKKIPGLKWLAGDADSTAGQIFMTAVEIIDPTGLMSVDDAIEAYFIWRKKPSTFNWMMYALNLFNCVPNMGLFMGAGAGAAAGAAGAGVGAIPGAAAGAAIGGGGWIGLRGSIHYATKNAAKFPKLIEEIYTKMLKLVKGTKGGPEAMAMAAEKIGGAEAKKAAIDAFGKGTGETLEATAKTGTLKGLEGKSPEEVAKWTEYYARAAMEGIKTNKTFKELVDKQIYYLGERMKKNPREVYGEEGAVKKAIEFIVDNPADALVAPYLHTIGKEMGNIPPASVIDVIRKVYPDLKYFDKIATPGAALKAAEGAAKIEKEVAKTAETGAEAASKEAAKSIETKTANATQEVIQGVGKGLAKSAKKTVKKLTRVGLPAFQAYRQMQTRLFANIINPLNAWFDKKMKETSGRSGGTKDEGEGNNDQSSSGPTLPGQSNMVYTFGGRVLTPAQAAALGTFVTPAVYDPATKRYKEVTNIIRPGQQVLDPFGKQATAANPMQAAPIQYNQQPQDQEYDTTLDFVNKLRKK